MLKSLQRVLLCFFFLSSFWEAAVVKKNPNRFFQRFSTCEYFCVCGIKINNLFHIGNGLFRCAHWSFRTAGTLATLTPTCCSPFALLPQAKRRLALDDSDHQHQSEPIRTPRGKAATANGTRIKAPRSKQFWRPTCMYLPSAAQLRHRSTRNTPTCVQHVTVLCLYKNASCRSVWFPLCWTVHPNSRCSVDSSV